MSSRASEDSFGIQRRPFLYFRLLVLCIKALKMLAFLFFELIVNDIEDFFM